MCQGSGPPLGHQSTPSACDVHPGFGSGRAEAGMGALAWDSGSNDLQVGSLLSLRKARKGPRGEGPSLFQNRATGSRNHTRLLEPDPGDPRPPSPAQRQLPPLALMPCAEQLPVPCCRASQPAVDTEGCLVLCRVPGDWLGGRQLGDVRQGQKSRRGLQHRGGMGPSLKCGCLSGKLRKQVRAAGRVQKASQG